jgi:hypothetical protein
LVTVCLGDADVNGEVGVAGALHGVLARNPTAPIGLGKAMYAQPAIEAAALEGHGIVGERGEVDATGDDIRLQVQHAVAGVIEP